jgi:hypothetical protein
LNHALDVRRPHRILESPDARDVGVLSFCSFQGHVNSARAAKGPDPMRREHLTALLAVI